MNQSILTAAAILLLSGSPAFASEPDEVAFASEVNACLAEVNQRADYHDATRVRHTVVELKNTFSGYVLSIDTDVFTGTDDNAARAYSAYCVAKGESKPRKFRFDQQAG